MIDRDVILSIIKECAEGLSPLLRETEAAQSYADKLLSHATILSEKDGNDIGGLIAFYTGSPAHREAFITMVAVRPTARGKQVGHRLVSRALQHARAAGCHSVRLAVQSNNPRAQRLYEHAGFSVCDHTADQLIMDRPL